MEGAFMADYYKGQQFYYYHTQTYMPVYITLLGYDINYFYFKFPNGEKMKISKYLLGKVIFVSVGDKYDNLKANKKYDFYKKPKKTTKSPKLDDGCAIRVKAKKGDRRSVDFNRRLDIYWKNINKKGTQNDA